MSEKIYDQLHNTALALLARREHSEKELGAKIRIKHSVDEIQITEVLAAIKQRGLLSDRRFSESYARSRSGKGFGPVRIALELRDKGVAEETAQQALQNLAESWAELAHSVWRKKFSRLPKDFSERVKQESFLKYRGFRSEDIESLFKLVANEYS